MADTILIQASIRIGAPVDKVRAQYRDIDHHIRHNVHPDIEYAWEAGAPGERKIRTTFRIMGVPQFDVSLLEDAPDGSFVIRYLDGTNAGMVLVHEFVPVEGGTDVRLSANAPATLGRKLLGPLFKVGAAQVMKKALREDKADIEGGKHRPGSAAGDLDRALTTLGTPMPSVDGPEARAILSAACLVTLADSQVDEAELDALRFVAGKLGIPVDDVKTQIATSVVRAGGGDLTGQATAAGKELARHALAEHGLVAGALAALVSQGLSLGELEMLRALAAGAGFPEEALGPLVERVDEALNGH